MSLLIGVFVYSYDRLFTKIDEKLTKIAKFCKKSMKNRKIFKQDMMNKNINNWLKQGKFEHKCTNFENYSPLREEKF